MATTRYGTRKMFTLRPEALCLPEGKLPNTFRVELNTMSSIDGYPVCEHRIEIVTKYEPIAGFHRSIGVITRANVAFVLRLPVLAVEMPGFERSRHTGLQIASRLDWKLVQIQSEREC